MVKQNGVRVVQLIGGTGGHPRGRRSKTPGGTFTCSCSERPASAQCDGEVCDRSSEKAVDPFLSERICSNVNTLRAESPLNCLGFESQLLQYSNHRLPSTLASHGRRG